MHLTFAFRFQQICFDQTLISKYFELGIRSRFFRALNVQQSPMICTPKSRRSQITRSMLSNSLHAFRKPNCSLQSELVPYQLSSDASRIRQYEKVEMKFMFGISFEEKSKFNSIFSISNGPHYKWLKCVAFANKRKCIHYGFCSAF